MGPLNLKAMKTLLLQVNVPGKVKEKQGFLDYAPSIYSISNRNVKEYAKRIGVEYRCIDHCDYMPEYHPTWQRFAIMHEDYDEWDQIIYMDSDYVTHAMTPDLIEIVKDRKENFFAVVDNVGVTKTGDPTYFNAGFFIIRRPLIEKLKPLYIKYCIEYKKSGMVDQDALNAMRRDHFEDDYGKLSNNWNGVLAIKRPLFSTHYCALRKRDFKAEDYYRHETRKLKVLGEMTKEEIEDLYWNKDYIE